MSASDLWKGITSVSTVGRKRGRQKGLKRRVDLNRGQQIGKGRKGIQLPGLNVKVYEKSVANKIRILQDNQNYESDLQSMRSDLGVRTKQKIHPLERGFSGTTLVGRSIGIPDDLKDELKDFDVKIIQYRSKPIMVENIGRTRISYALVVCGNKNGLVGFAKAKSRDMKKSSHLARIRSFKRLRYIQLDGKTIIHDFFSSFGHTTIVCFKMPPGFGVVADNTIKSICNVMGIEDLYCNVIRNEKNRFNLVQAFIFGLTKQKTYQQIADEKGLNLVEFKEDTDYFPRLVARPSNGKVRKSSQIDPLEIMDFRQYLFDGRIYDPDNLDRGKPFLSTLNYARFLQIHHKHRSKLQSRAKLRRRYGEVESFLTLNEKAKRIKKFGKLPVRQIPFQTLETAESANE